MSARAPVSKPDLKRAAMVANETGCAIEIQTPGSIWRIYPPSQVQTIRQIDQKTDKLLVDMSDDLRM